MRDEGGDRLLVAVVDTELEAALGIPLAHRAVAPARIHRPLPVADQRRHGRS